MAEALYRKYRPATFSDVVGQEHIEKTLQNAIEQDKVSHAYLFCGPRGTGKTTTARILAKALLCEKAPTVNPDGTCPECQAIANGTHPDVYELDAASRTGVENVREEIINRVNYAPTRGKVKVYIIDEVHMLSTAAFNALLKTLEEPPEHVVFILCTTDPQKVPETIHSRCQRFDFHRISTDAIVARLGAICVKEGVSFEPKALELIAYRAEGGMRNALTSLEQVIAFGEGSVTLAGAQNLLGSLDDSGLAEVVSFVATRDAASCFKWVARYVETGADLADFVADLTRYIRNLYLLSVTHGEIRLSVSDAARKAMEDEVALFSEDRLVRLLGILDDVTKELRVSSNPRLSFEIALTRMVRPESDLTLESLAERIEILENRLTQASHISAPFAQGEQVMQFAVQPVRQPFAQHATPTQSQQMSQFQQQAAVQGEVSGASVAGSSTAPIPVDNQQAAHAIPSAPATQTTQPPQAVHEQSRQSQGYINAASAYSQTEPAASAAAVSQPQASVDISSPAKLQRLWKAVVAHLRKENPARGVLFINARISAVDNNSTIQIEFDANSGFAYDAARKPEVQKLLQESILAVASASVPFRLSMQNDTPASSRATNASYASPAVQSSSAPAVSTAQPPYQQTPPQSYSVQAQPAQSQVGFVQSSSVQQPQETYDQAAQSQSAQSASPTVPYLAEEQVPLQAYESYIPQEEASQQYVSSRGSVQPNQANPSVISQPESTHVQRAEDAPSPASLEVSQPQTPSAQTQPSAVAEEAEQVENLLIQTFGEGIKFD